CKPLHAIVGTPLTTVQRFRLITNPPARFDGQMTILALIRAKTLSFFGHPVVPRLTLAISTLCCGSTRPWIETRFPGLPLVCVSQSPQLPKARRFGAKRDSLFTLDSERRCRLEAQCLFPISAFPIRSSPQLRPPVTRPLPPSRNRRSPTCWRAAMFSASPRPAPVRPLPSSCPCS